MAHIPNRDDPYLDRANDPLAPRVGENELARDIHRNPELQVDPELAQGRSGGSRALLYAIAAVAILGAVFYGLSGSERPDTAVAPTAGQTDTAQTGGPSAPTGPVRDVTPRGPNTTPGMTTGAAPSQPAPMTNGFGGNPATTPQPATPPAR